MSDQEYYDDSSLDPAEVNRRESHRRRLAMVELIKAGYTNAEMGRRLGVNFRTIACWRRLYEQGGVEALTPRRPTGGRPGRTQVKRKGYSSWNARWRTLPPYEPGWYWAWRRGDMPRLVRVERWGERLRAWDRGAPFSLDYWSHWIGPVHEPRPPEGER